MDEHIRQLLDKIPERPPRSKLEHHAEVIRELRRKRRTYQEIAVFFREHLQISVSPSTVHDFVKKRSKQARSRPAEVPKSPSESSLGATPMQVAPTSDAVQPPSKKDARDTIRAVRTQPLASSREPSLFEFELESPLTSDPKAKEEVTIGADYRTESRHQGRAVLTQSWERRRPQNALHEPASQAVRPSPASVFSLLDMDSER